MKIARWVWSRGKDGDYIKVLPIAIKVTGSNSGKTRIAAAILV
ncbi:hypothetical protein V7111_01125 [Neobacillus niacini]